jgi:hypothetical protein
VNEKKIKNATLPSLDFLLSFFHAMIHGLSEQAREIEDTTSNTRPTMFCALMPF